VKWISRLRSWTRALRCEGGSTNSSDEKTIAEVGGIHSNAYNFMSAVTSGVDPRTGMYSSSISLPVVAANNLCGPNVQLGLSFSPLNPVNAGFGIGWSLTTTRYDSRRKRLSLSSGESFLLDTFVDDIATFKDRKLRTFDMIREGVDGDYRIVHSSGEMELLSAEAGSDGVSVLREVRSPEGYRVMLEQSASNGVVKLREVADGTGRKLLSVAYEDASTQVIVRPESSQPVAFTFDLRNDRLVGLALPAGYGDGWVFAYEARIMSRPRPMRRWWPRVLQRFGIGGAARAGVGVLLLKRVVVPTGGSEEVDYRWEGHALPGAGNQPLTHMPVVTTCRRDPGHDQPVIVTRYAYSENHNYFGYGALNDWTDDEDNLYRVVMPPNQRYEYSSTETHYDGIDRVRTVERTFNRFHLLTSERTSQQGCVRELVTVYDEDPAASFASQRPWCQLPAEKRTLHYRLDDPTRVSEDVQRFTYDEGGNRLSFRDENGALEQLDYYPASGDEGCPPDPLGFVRCVRQRRMIPPEGTEGSVKVTRYRYDALPNLVPGEAAHLLSVYEGIHHEVAGRLVEVPLSETTQRFAADGGPDHGRLSQVASMVNGVRGTTDYAYVNGTRAATAKGDLLAVLVTTEMLTRSTGRDDALSVSKRIALATDTGLRVMEESPGGVVTRYGYDDLGRIVRQSVAENTPFSAVKTFVHALAHEGSWQEETSATGQTTRTELDGFGQAIRSVALNWMDDGKEREVWRANFDALGRAVSQTATDYNVPLEAGALGEISATRHCLYDAWGNIAQSIAPDGVVEHVQIDPVSHTEEAWTEANGMLIRRSHTTYRNDGQAARVERRDARGMAQWWQTFVYDGWGRCMSSTESAVDAPDKTTQYRYDEYDRVTETVRPDGAVVVRNYAAYTGDALVESIGVRHVPTAQADEVTTELGQQHFDGLARTILRRSGALDTRFSYHTPRSEEPDEIHLPSGDVLLCTYETQLGDRPLAIANREKTLEYHFGYHPLLGQRISATSEFGRHETEYFPNGRVKADRFQYDTDEVRQNSFSYSLLGMTAAYVSVDGEKHDIRYDDLGRVTSLTSDTVAVTFAYDAFSRTKQMRTTTTDGERLMEVSLAFDDFGREIERRLLGRSGATETTQTLTQSYTASDKLRARVWTTAEGTRTESYEYDVMGRLVVYACMGVHAPTDSSGAAISRQQFTFDALDNMLALETTYADAGVAPAVSTFHHAADDPTRLIRIEHAQGASHETLLLDYDANGNLKFDEAGRELTYDAMGRLVRWTQGSAWQDYRYDPLDRVGAVDTPTSSRHRYYLGGQVAWENSESTSSSFHVAGGMCVAQSKVDAAGRQTILLGADAQGSVVSEAGASLTLPAYTVYGHRADDAGGSDIAYAGELKERTVGWYLLGSYRAYNPRLMRFHSPDANSPFGRGGLNAYTYVSGDPVNRVDPSGEGFLDWLPVIIGAIGTAVGVVLSAGALAPAAAALWAGAAVSFTQAAVVISTGVGVLSVTTAAGSVALNQSGHKTAGSVLGWMSAGYGVGSAAVGMAPAAGSIGRAVSTGVSKVHGAYRSVARIPGKLIQGGEKLRRAGGPPPSWHAPGKSAGGGYTNRGFVPGADIPPAQLTGMQRINSPGQSGVASNVSGQFQERIGYGIEDVQAVVEGWSTTERRYPGQITRGDLVDSGFDAQEVADMIDNVTLDPARRSLIPYRSKAGDEFRRYTANRNNTTALRESKEALQIIRDGGPTHSYIPAHIRAGWASNK
jgi:RHS repeat-associated protein